jgi:methylmalonyl-CoA mutase C-terminal domain/subunit
MCGGIFTVYGITRWEHEEDSMAERPIKVLMAKPGMDGHWRGIIVVTMALRDAGMEVIYGGNMSPAQIAEAAMQEDVDVVGLSVLVDTYMRLVRDTEEALKALGKGDVLLLVGGIIFDEDIPFLKKMGVSEVFGPGGQVEDIVEYIRLNAMVTG